MTYACDLHAHTYYSDGRASPRELLAQAAAIGLRVLAITDHDTAQGARVAIPLAGSFGLDLVPGIELTCRWYASGAPPGKTDVDILGYYLDLEDATFRAVEVAALADINARVADCCALLTAGGHPLAMEQVFAQNPRSAGIQAVIHALIANGVAADWAQAMALLEGQWARVRPSALTIGEAIGAIRAAGGVAVLAHPTDIVWQGGWVTADGLSELVAMGLDGLELYHPRVDAAARARWSPLVRRFDLLVTGGSDEHGWPDGLRHLGSQPVTQEMVEALLARAEGRG